MFGSSNLRHSSQMRDETQTTAYGKNPTPSHMHMQLEPLRPISTQEKFPWTEKIAKISLLTSKFFSDGKFVPANHILQNFLSAENLLEWK